MKPTIQQITMPLAIDSGAHSLYNKYLSARDSSGRQLSGISMIEQTKWDYLKTPKFRKYLDNYMEAIRRTNRHLEFAVSLDIPYNGTASWEIFKEMTDEGLKVMPVYHYGEPPELLKKYMDRSDYIGIGGLGQYNNKQNWLPFGNRTWKMILDGKGRPRVKVHGFAMSSFDLMRRWPWYSVDSTSACTFSRMGAIMLPSHQASGTLDYAITPIIVPLAKGRHADKKFLGHRHPGGLIHSTVVGYLETKGFTVEAATNSYIVRDAVNLSFMAECAKTLSRLHSEAMNSPWTTFYYTSGNPTDSIFTFDKVLAELRRLKALSHLKYLGTFFESNCRAIEYFLDLWHNVKLRG